MIGEPSIYEGAGIKPDSSDIVGRCGKDQRIVAVCWKAEGGDPGDARKAAWGSFDPYIEEARAKAEPPGAGKKGIHEHLVHCYPGERLAGYKAFTRFTRTNGMMTASPGAQFDRFRPVCPTMNAGL